jgi:hypothetical protein
LLGELRMLIEIVVDVKEELLRRPTRMILIGDV